MFHLLLRAITTHVVLFLIAVLVVVLPLFIYAGAHRLNTLEDAYRPVVKGMRIVSHYNSDGYSYIRVFGSKIRDCGPPLAITGTYGEKVFTSIAFLDDLDTETGSFSVPTAQPVKDEIDFGWWRLAPAISPQTIVITVFHSCEESLVRTTMVMKMEANPPAPLL